MYLSLSENGISTFQGGSRVMSEVFCRPTTWGLFFFHNSSSARLPCLRKVRTALEACIGRTETPSGDCYSMGLFKGLYRLLSCCWRSAADADPEPDVVMYISPVKGKHSKPGQQDCIPEVFTKKYGKVVPHDVDAREAVCITSDVAVLGDAGVQGDTCITGNLLIAGSVKAKGSICVTGDVIVLANAHVEGQVCVTGNVFVKGDLAVRGKLDVGGKLCVFGSKDVQPADV